MTDLEKAFTALQGKQTLYTTLWAYYDGDQPLVYSSERLRKVFTNLNAKFVQNWCAVVVDACMDRITLDGLQVAEDDAATDLLAQTLQETGLDLDSFDAHLASLVTGEAFVIAWPETDEETKTTLTAYYNDPRLCHIQYDPANPRKKLWAAKWWVNVEGGYSLTLYYPDRLEYYITKKKHDQVSTAGAFEPAEIPQADNPYGVIPVFHLRLERRKTVSALINALCPQDGVNKLFADMMVAAEFGAFRQRYVIANASVANLKNAPNEIWRIPPGDGQGQQSSAGEFAATELGNYLQAMDKLATSIAIITRTPKHFFFTQGGDPSGEALIAMEAPLNKKCARYISCFTPTWREIGAFLLQLLGHPIEPDRITPQFAKPETVQPRTQAEILQMETAAGMPLVSALRDQGRDQAEIDQVAEDKAAATAAGVQGLAQALMEQERRASQFGQQEAGNGQ